MDRRVAAQHEDSRAHRPKLPHIRSSCALRKCVRYNHFVSGYIRFVSGYGSKEVLSMKESLRARIVEPLTATPSHENDEDIGGRR